MLLAFIVGKMEEFTMQNVKILEMINNEQIEELKKMIQDEIYTDALKSKSGAKQRYAAMKKYFSYVKSNGNKIFEKPCVIDFEGKKHTSFVNGYSIALTKEKSGEMELFKETDKYLDVEKMIVFDGKEKEVDFNKIIAEAKSKGYKLKKSEVENSEDFKYVLHYDGAYYKIGLLDATYNIINDGEKATVYHKDGSENSPIVIKNSIGICVVLPFNYTVEDEEGHIKNDKVVIEVA